jgi:hypothetical protein
MNFGLFKSIESGNIIDFNRDWAKKLRWKNYSLNQTH